MKAGLMEEMMNDAMEGLDADEVEEEAEEETQKIIDEVTQGLIDKAGGVVRERPGGQVGRAIQKAICFEVGYRLRFSFHLFASWGFPVWLSTSPI